MKHFAICISMAALLFGAPVDTAAAEALSAASAINKAGRQRMLSQRIAKLYMCHQAGVRDAAVLDSLQQVKSEFKGALAELKAAQQNTESIRQGLDATGTQWQLLEYSLENADKPLAEFVALTSEKILSTMDGVTAAYEGLPGK